MPLIDIRLNRFDGRPVRLPRNPANVAPANGPIAGGGDRADRHEPALRIVEAKRYSPRAYC
jgi:hypothetical protein